MLIPLAGCPMINYSIDLLINSKVNEIFIICSSHAEQLEEYINSSQWQNKHWFPKLKIHIERIPYCDTVGAALRHMHTLNYIQSKTFVLCHGDVVANISLRKIIETHQQRYKNDTSTLMTCLFKNAHYKQRSKSLEDDLFIVTNDDNELLQYSNDRLTTDLSFDISIFDEHEEIEINHNLIDCGIDICSKTVLSLFEDNFDYESIRGELFEGVIRSEIYNYKIYASFLNEENEYASRVIDWHSYNGITFDIIERWTYPLVLDSNTISHNYIYQRNNIYKEDKVKIGLNTEIIKNTILGYNTSIGNNCIINKSVIGINCIIGNNTHITNSFIFGDCIIGNNCILIGIVMANNVIIGNYCNIKKGCIISYNVQIDNNITLKPYTKITFTNDKYDSDDDDFAFDSDDAVQLPAQKHYKQSPKGRVRALSGATSTNNNIAENDTNNESEDKKQTIMGIMDSNENNNNNNNNINSDSIHTPPQNMNMNMNIQYDFDIVGKNGKGFLYEIKDNDKSFVYASINNVLACEDNRLQRGYPMYTQTPQTINITASDSHIIDAPIGNGNDNDMNKRYTVNQLVLAISECIESAENNKSVNMDDVVIEISTSVRLSHNAELIDFSCAVFLVILNRISDDLSLEEKKNKIEYYMVKYACIFEKLAKKEEEQIKVIIGLYNACDTRKNGFIYFCEGLDKLWDEDTVLLGSIQKWNQDRNKSNDERFEQYIKNYIEAWVEAENSDSDDDDDDDSDSD